MKKRITLFSIFLITVSFVFCWPTKEYFSFSYSQGFNFENIKDSNTCIISGAGRIDGTSFFGGTNYGLGAVLSIGGPYNFSSICKESGVKSSTPSNIIDLGISFMGGIGFALDIPINDIISMYGIIGPEYDIWMLENKDFYIYDILFGSLLTIGARFFPNKIVQFIVGCDFVYNFGQIGYVKTEYEVQKFEPFTSFSEIKPFIGVSFKTDSIYKNFNNFGINRNNKTINKTDRI